MKGYMLFKDGRRQEMEPQDVGCIRFFRPSKGDDGQVRYTIFEAQAEVIDDCIIYEEKETVDRHGLGLRDE